MIHKISDELYGYLLDHIKAQLALCDNLLSNSQWVENKKQYQPEVLERIVKSRSKLDRFYKSLKGQQQ